MQLRVSHFTSSRSLVASTESLRPLSEAFMVYITLTIDVLDKHMGQVHAQALLLEERKR